MHDPAILISVALVALLGVALCAGGWLAARRRKISLPQFCLYCINTMFTRLLWRTQISGPLPIADDQGAVIVCNHRSGIDPLLIQLGTQRVVHWLVAKEYMEHPAMAWAFRILRSIPVNRGGVDTAATKSAIRLTQQGGLVGLFPEGRVNTTDDFLLPGRPGAALIALKARVPVIPCYIEGAPYNGTALGSFLMTAHARVNIGQPIDIEEYVQRRDEKGIMEEMTKRFLVEIARLAGKTDFEPQLAGKRWRTAEDAAALENGEDIGTAGPSTSNSM